MVNTYLDSFPEGGFGVVHTRDELVDNLSVALSDFAADKQAKISAAADLNVSSLRIHSYRLSMYCTLSVSGSLFPLHNIVQSLVVLTSNLNPIVHQIIGKGLGMP